MKEREKFALKDWQRRCKLFNCLIGWFKQLLWMRWVDLIYKSEGGWLLELSDNKLFDNNLASELVEYSSFSNYHNQLSIV